MTPSNLIKGWIKNALIRYQLSQGELMIQYKKIDSLPQLENGYTNIEVTAKRYQRSAQNINKKQIFMSQAVRDNVYFIEHECNKYWSDTIKPLRLLDIGCGNGIYSKVFQWTNSALRKAHYTGSEVNEKIVEICKNTFPSKKFIVSLAQNISQPDNSYELVFCSSTLHYALSHWQEAIREMARVSNKYLIFARLPVSKYASNFYVHQVVQSAGGKENEFFIVLNRQTLENFFLSSGLKILTRDYSSEEYNIDGIGEKIILVQYLLEKGAKS